MRVFAIIVTLCLMASVYGCEKKTPAEQLKADMQKASNQMNKDVQGLLK